MKLEIWYQQESSDDDNAGEPAVVIDTAADLDALLDRVVSASRAAQVPSMIEVSLADDPASPVLQVGLGPDHGFIAYIAEDGGLTYGDGTQHGNVHYDYMGNVTEVPAHAEIPTHMVRDGVREFLHTGTRPGNIPWQRTAT